MLLNLRAGRAAIYRGSQGKVTQRAQAGSETEGQAEALKIAQRVIGTGRSEHRAQVVGVPLHGINRNVAGALLLDLPFEGEDFTDFEFRFCQRCARWNEVARMGRARPPKPRLEGDDTSEEYDMSSTLEVRLTPASKAVRSTVEVGSLTRPSVFFRSLHTMIHAGLPLNESIYFLAASSEDVESRKVLESLGDKVTEGVPLSVAMSDFPNSFSTYLVGLVQVGEHTGALSQVLLTLSEYLETSSRLERKLRTALVYPAILTVVAFALLFFAPPYLLQGQLSMIEHSKGTLPTLTRLFLGWAAFCRTGVPVAMLSAAGVAGWLALRSKSLRRRFLGILAARPPFHRLMLVLSSARFARAMSLSIRSGQNMTEALAGAAVSTGDPELARMGKKAADWVFEGDTLVESLKGTRYFPKGYCEVLVAGEETGRTEVMFDLLSDMYEMELDLSVATLTSLVEPILLLLVGVVTALVLVATMQPTVALLQSV